ncbi:MAG: type II secretion system GspH family protein [Candidatus Gastranaerophilales bacterium]|nr:type II secretion system GspH family protein [Candidatus Gastranaerophilales bacterium]
MKKYKAFTLAEALVTMAIIGVIAAISLPLLSKSRPDKDAIMYKKAVSTLKYAMTEIQTLENNNGSDYFNYLKTNGTPNYCEKLAAVIKTSGGSDCSSAGTADNPNFQAADGIKYYFTGDNITKTSGSIHVYFERPMTEKEEKQVSTLRSDRYNEITRIGVTLDTDKGTIETDGSFGSLIQSDNLTR